MNVVWHNHKRVELIVQQIPISIANGIHHHLRDLGYAQEKRSTACVIQNAVHGEECLSRGQGRRKTSLGREAAVQAPSEENRLTYRVIVWQSAAVKSGHQERVWLFGGKILTKVTRPIANRPTGFQPAP